MSCVSECVWLTSVLAHSWQPAPVCGMGQHSRTTDKTQKTPSAAPLNPQSQFLALTSQMQFLLLFMSRLCRHISKSCLAFNNFSAFSEQWLLRVNLQKTHIVSILNFSVGIVFSINYHLLTWKEQLIRCSMSGNFIRNTVREKKPHIFPY